MKHQDIISKLTLEEKCYLLSGKDFWQTRSVKAKFPTAAAIANSWDPELGEEIGHNLGREAAAQDVCVLLGPGMNIKRSPSASAYPTPPSSTVI